MRLWDTPKPKPGTLTYKFCEFFVNHINFCEGYYYGTEMEKPDNKFYNWLYKYWLFPFKQTNCICCNTVRGLMYGLAIGYVIGRIV